MSYLSSQSPQATRTHHSMSLMVRFLILCFGGLSCTWSPCSSFAATVKPNQWLVSITDTPDPVASTSTFTYQVSAKNDGRVKSTNVRISVTLPLISQFVSCKTSLDTKTAPRCQGVVDGQVLATFPSVRAHQKVTVTIEAKAPSVSTNTDLLLTAKAEGENAQKGDDSEHTSVLAPGVSATLLPSGRIVTLYCGDILTEALLQPDTTTVQLNGTLGCQADAPFGLKVMRHSLTLDLNGHKIIGEIAKNTVGIVIGANTTNVVVDGGGTNGVSGIEFFDWCLKDEGGNQGSLVKNLRCYRSRSAAIDILSNNMEISKVKIDSIAPTTSTTQELPGGVCISAHGDNIRIKDTIVRRCQLIGIFADGVDTDLNGVAVTIDGNTSTSRVESSNGIGVVLQNGPHLLKDTAVYGDGPGEGTSTNGVVVDTGSANKLDGVKVKNFNQNGIVINASGTTVSRSGVESVAQHGLLITTTASNVMISGTNSKGVGGAGFVVDGSANLISTNGAEGNAGAGFQINGVSNQVENNSAAQNTGIGYLISGSNNICNTNSAEDNLDSEWLIAANNEDDSGNEANGQSITFTAAGGIFE